MQRTISSRFAVCGQMPVPDLVLPGHPRADVTPQSPCLSQDAGNRCWSRGSTTWRPFSRDMRPTVPTSWMGHRSSSLPDLYYLGDFRGSAVYGFFASSKFFLVDAPGALAWLIS